MKRIKIIVLFTLFPAIFLSAQETLEQNIKKSLDSIVNESGYPGAVFSYVLADGTIHSVASGYADIERKMEMTPEYKMLSGSTGKTFVSAIALKLIDKGKLRLNDSLKCFFSSEPWFSKIPNHNTITVHHLMQHTSGIQRYEFKERFLADVVKDPDRVWKPEELLFYVFDDQPLFKAGTSYSYADTNYILLGMIIEKVTGERYYDILKKWITDPLVLTSVVPSTTKVIDSMACGYSGENNEFGFTNRSIDENGKFNNNTQFEWTGGGLAYKTRDYAKWLKLLHGSKFFINEELITEFYSGFPTKEGSDYGLGLQIYNIPNFGEIYGHSGFFPGYLTIGNFHRDTRTIGVLQINTSETDKLSGFFRNYLFLFKKVISHKN